MTPLDTLKDWLARVDAHRADLAARLELGRGPCPGSADDRRLVCDNCDSDEDPSDQSSPGDPCPEATGEEQCRGRLQYRYDPASAKHDFDGGECWRCTALSPRLYEGDGPFAANLMAEPEASIPESVIRAIVAALSPDLVADLNQILAHPEVMVAVLEAPTSDEMLVPEIRAQPRLRALVRLARAVQQARRLLQEVVGPRTLPGPWARDLWADEVRRWVDVPRPHRKPAALAFTAGPTRDLATRIEAAERMAAEEVLQVLACGPGRTKDEFCRLRDAWESGEVTWETLSPQPTP